MNNIRKRLSAWSASALLTFAPCMVLADTIYSSDVTLSSSPKWSDDVTINEGVGVVLGKNILPGHTTNITINLLGSLTFNSDKTDNHGAANSLVVASNRSLDFTGTGTLVKTGSGVLATLSGEHQNANGYGVKFAFSDGALIDVQGGTFRNGGWKKQNWSENKADLRIASGAQFDVWDGIDSQFDSLVGAGKIVNGTTSVKSILIGVANSTWLVDGVQTTPEFSGIFNSGMISLTKDGTGTQILSGSYLSTGTITVSNGLLQIGNGTTGAIGKNANVAVAENASLVFNTLESTELAKSLSGKGTIDLQKGTLLLKENNNFKGTIKTATGTTLGLGVNDFSNLSVAAGTNLMLNVNEDDENAFTAAQFNTYRTQGETEGFAVGLYTPQDVSVSQSVEGELLAVNSNLKKVGGGVFALIGANSNFTSTINVADGAISLGDGTTSASISSDVDVAVDAGAQFIFNNGANSTTIVANAISGSGELVVASGTVRYSKDSPVFLSKTSATYGAGAARIDLPQVTVQNGARLVFEDGVTPTFNNKNGTFTIEAGGIMELIGSSRSENHYWDNSANFISQKMTINGAGTLLKTGSKAVALLCRENASGTVVMAMSEGGWIDVKEGQLLNGGWSVNIDWTSNKSSLNVASGAKLNMWDGIVNSNVYVDSLTGAGTLERGHIHLGVANNVASETYGVADNTAIFSGKITGDKAAVTKSGSGTQIFTGANSYSGNTTVNGGVLQIGNGGNTGKIGTGSAIVNENGILRFNTSQTNAVAEFCGQGTVQAENSGKVTANSLALFAGTLNPLSNSDVIEINTAENQTGTLSAKVVGNGTVSLVMRKGAAVDMRMASVADSASVAVSGGTLTINGNNFNGTLLAKENATLNLASTVSYQANPWDMNYYANNLRLTPNATATPTIEYGEVYDMWQAANASSMKDVVKIMTQNQSTLSYRTFIEVTEDLSIDFAGKFDDSQGVWIIPCDANGTPQTDATWSTLLGYSDNCALNSVSGVKLTSGYYLIDVRVTDNAGDRYAMSGVSDADGKNLGIGMKLSDAKTYSAMNIDQETGVLNGSNGKIIAGKAYVSGEQVWNNAKLDIAENTTLTIDNPSANVSAVSLQNAKITGKGTLALAASGNEKTQFNLLGLNSTGSVSVGENVAATLAGSIGGDLLLEDGASLNFDFDVASNSAPILTLGGQTDLTDVILNINATGEAPEDGVISAYVLIQANENAIDGLDLENFNWNIEDENLRLTADLVNGSLIVTAGNAATLPEPASVVMMILGIGIFSGFAIAKKRRTR